MKCLMILLLLLAIWNFGEARIVTMEEIIATSFVANFESAVKYKIDGRLEELFDDKLLFFECEDYYYKNDVIKYALALPSTVLFTLDRNSIQRLNEKVISFRLKVTQIPHPRIYVFEISAKNTRNYLLKFGYTEHGSDC